MKVILFGATGMVGQGVLRECLAAGDVQSVLVVGRSALGQTHLKLSELTLPSLADYAAVEARLTGYDACFFCLGVSSAGMSEPDYTQITYELTLTAAQTLARLNAQMVFVYVSGAGTDSTEKGRSMWARVKGKTENALLRQPFKAAYLFRPGFIQPLHGITSRTPLYRALYTVVGPLSGLLRMVAPTLISTTEEVGRAMLGAVREGGPSRVVEAAGLRALAERT